MATLTGSTIASTYNLLVKRNETYSQTGTNIELMIADGTVAPTGLYLESGATTDNVGIGTATPNNILTVYDATTSIIQVTNNFGGVGVAADAGLKIQYYEDDASIINQDADGKMHLGCADSIDMTILASGNVGIGTSSPEDLLDVRGTGLAASTQPTITLSTPDDTSVVNGSLLGKIVWSADDASDAGREEVAAITYKANETWNTSNREGYLSFGASNTGAYTDDIMVVGFEGGEARVGIEDTTPSYTLDVTGTGNLTSTGYGTWADYAEFFETVDGNDISAGTTVVLIDGKVRAAEEGESPMGVISDNPQFCGNADGRKTWQGKFVKDAYGNYEYELGEDGTPKIDMAARKISPDYDESLEYINRETRPEWVIVGLLGQIPVNKGQVVPSSWLKMKVITADVDMYYVFPAPQVIK